MSGLKTIGATLILGACTVSSGDLDTSKSSLTIQDDFTSSNETILFQSIVQPTIEQAIEILEKKNGNNT